MLLVENQRGHILLPLYTTFVHSIKRSRYQRGTKFDKGRLAVEQNNYLNRTVNAYIVYDLDACPRNPTDNFKFKNWLFGATNIIKSSDKEKWMYSGYEIKFDSAGSQKFANEFASNIVMFGVSNNSSFHIDNRKNNFLVLGEVLTYGINESFVSVEKNVSNNCSKQT